MFTKVHLVSTLPSSVRSVVVSMIVTMVVLIVPFTLQIKRMLVSSDAHFVCQYLQIKLKNKIK